MPIVRKVMDMRTSRAVCLPKSWLEYAENESGSKVTHVAIEVDRVLTISPIFPDKKKHAEEEKQAT
jgi:antitoxin component of MazEF toxin-antitoxin module